MKKIILLLLTFLAFTPNIYASSKKVDPWKYEPQRKAGTDILDIIAERTVEKSLLDQVVDNTTLHDVITETEKRQASVQATSATAKKAMGNTMMKRIFQNTLKGGVWGALGVSALQSLLEGIDWVMDPKTQSIWRNKKQDPNASGVTCSYTAQLNGKTYRVYYLDSEKNKYGCPMEAATALMKQYTYQSSLIRDKYQFLRWTTVPGGNVSPRFEGMVYKVSDGQGAVISFTLGRELIEEVIPDPPKEYLKDEDLADYMLGKHADFQKPEYSTKLPAPNTWTSVAEAFKPANDYEYDNNPAVQLAKHAIDNGTAIRDESNTNTNVNQKPDGSGFNLPSFCTWAKYVCDFVDWYKEAPEKENEQPDQDIDDKGIFSRKFDTVFSLSKDCPPDIPFNLDAYYFQGSYTISLRWLCIIFTALGYPLMFVAHCTGIWILYEAVIRKEIRAN
ncbi:hypothetical protein [Acinetobacter seifertii]|uniref:hypothetical protein n=1 Tax=Acinetobacter seifertii TaxID=1530123 RepID=UPI001250800C|nr:hypothetical protein [Acinetobacter seifertii]